ncbi:MAG: sulfotransferase, partial [Acidobacteria bacterium]|nr:sulfotransferase [Acidobacteriota bacterium]
MAEDFSLLMLSAMYENGGNTTHRFLDGHPEMFVYPFESQIGTRRVVDYLSSMFPAKYRWPQFALDAEPAEDYREIIDEECKVRARTPQVSKFRHMPFDFSDDERREIYTCLVKTGGRSTANNVAAFFRSTFDAWKDYKRSGAERIYVGYSPIIIIDADRALRDMPRAHILHIVRNPWSAYADTKKRPVPLSLRHYMTAWSLNQHSALIFKDKFPGHVHILRAEDVMAAPRKTLGDFCNRLGLESPPSLSVPTWNGKELEEVYPWGT